MPRWSDLRETLSHLLAAPIVPRWESRIRAAVGEALDARQPVLASELAHVGAHLSHARLALDELKRDVDALAAMGRDLQARHDARQEAKPLHPGALRAIEAAARFDHAEANTRAIEALEDELRATAARAVGLRAALDAAEVRVAAGELKADAALDDAQRNTERLARLSGPVEALSAAAAPRSPSPAHPPPAEAAPAAPARTGCKVPGCTGAHRARGFCGAHYQRWTRQILPGVVFADGTFLAELDGPRLRLSADGQPVEGLSGEVISPEGSRWRAAGRLLDAQPGLTDRT
jgi:hypothetical protein